MKKFLFYTLLYLIFTSCSQEKIAWEHEETPSPNTSITESNDGVIILGKRLENPYSLKNMKQAFKNLAPQTRNGIQEKDILPTHYYVKFHPKSEHELDILKQDTTVIWYEYPLDYEIKTLGVSYHDPAIPDSLPTYQYASIDIAKWEEIKQLPIAHEILEELFIPDEDSDEDIAITTRSSHSWSEEFIENLVDESFRLTGNEEPYLETRGRSKWRPAGNITVYDDIMGKSIPLVGAKVRARRWFTTHIGYTNPNGDYSCNGRFKRPANYCIIWEGSDWDIRDGAIGQAYLNGPKQKGNWNVNITSGKSLRYATIHRAAYRYYHGNIAGFFRPANTKREKICYFDKDGTSTFWGNMGLGILPDIKIYGKSSSRAKQTYEIFGTTSHELSHVAHCTWMRKIQYWQVSKIIYESWADFVEWSLLRLEYKELGATEAKIKAYIEINHYNHQKWPVERGKLAYSSLFIDLVDKLNQGMNNQNLPFDEVSGYSNAVLNKIVLDSYGLSGLKTELKKLKPIGVTDKKIDKLFEVYEKAWN